MGGNPRRKERKCRIVGSGLIMMLVAAGCGTSNGTSDTPTGPASDPTATAGAAGDAPTTPDRRPEGFWTIGTGGTGGTYYPLGGTLSRLLTQDDGYFADVSATAEVTGATIENTRLVTSGEVEIGMGEASGMYLAVNGTGPFAGDPQDRIRALVVPLFSYVQIVVRADSGITNFRELAGRRVGVGEAGGSSAVLAESIAEALGMSLDDFSAVLPYGLADNATGLAGREQDAGFFLGALNLAALQELNATTDIFMLGFEGEDAQLVQETHPFMTLQEIPPGTYEGQTEPWGPVLTSSNTIFVRDDFDEEDAYQLTKLLFEHYDEFLATHPSLEAMVPESVLENPFMPMHPGAIRYLLEQGVELEDHHFPPEYQG